MRTFSILMAASLLAGCGDSAIQDAHKAVAYQLMDPASAQFREDRELADGSVCGQVNGKNSYGAYSGFGHYLARKGADGFQVVLDPQGSNASAAQACGYPLAAVPVAPPAQAPAAPVAGSKGPNEIAGVRWSVQLASTSAESASLMSKKLAGFGYSPYVAREDNVSRVFVGPFDSRSEATRKLDQLRHDHKIRGIVVRYRGVGDLPAPSVAHG
ncbi:sporulation domain-containing protein [Pseudomonas sp. M47T1]|uniref:SPOR domain-containing protein n=1 Tax=unclassified Pseudomonas TaxID=196821 RepID=UPI0002608689|nr:SPOR domain-containing protein [Pseudomonas sp. M47T1]EIK93288.1 sporulation domain-containing protein [Pseudomonas sp. M47T1]